MFTYVRIEDLSRFVKPVERYDARDPQYRSYWREQMRRSCEGVWAYDNGGMRYMPGRLYFYGHFGTVEQWDPVTATRKLFTPSVRDLEWERAYMMLTCEGFSGFDADPGRTSYRGILTESREEIRKRAPAALKPDGSFKEYVPAHEFLRGVHDKPLGRPLYQNNALNSNELGSRGGGKSYSVSQMYIGHGLVTDGVRYYVPGQKRPRWTCVVGSGREDKSDALLSKVEEMMTGLREREDLGAIGQPGEDGYRPCPLAKLTMGSLKSGNAKDPFRTAVAVKVNGKWTEKGSGSRVIHQVYSINKRDGAEAAAGFRANMVLYEEIGLMETLVEAWRSNDAVTTSDGVRFGVQMGIGTSGNIETIGPARKIFTNPSQFDCVPFRGMEPGSGETGFFVNAVFTNAIYKDANGNTDVAASKAYYDRIHKEARDNPDPSALPGVEMNYPTLIKHMWQKGESKLLPSTAAVDKLTKLEKGNTYAKLATFADLKPDPLKPDGWGYDKRESPDPINEWPIVYSKQRKSFDGEVIIYDPPMFQHEPGAPDDLYVGVYDPVGADGMYRDASMACTQIWIHPRYWQTYVRTTPLVATYFGRPGIREWYHNKQADLLKLYGAGRGHRILFYERDRGDDVYHYYKASGRLDWLATDPRITQRVEYGWRTGDAVTKTALVDDLREMLLVEIGLPGGATARVIDTVNDVQFLNQVASFDLEGNFDHISAATGLTILRKAEIARHEELSDAPKPRSRSGRKAKRNTQRAISHLR